MSDLLSRQPVLATIATAVTTYAIFKRYEPEKPIPLLFLLGVVPGTLSFGLWTYSSASDDLWALFKVVPATFAAFYTILVSCILLYRASPFHPLAKYPGPFLHRLSKWRMAYILYTRKENLGVDITYYQSLHKKYGPYVRIGPNELSVCDASWILPVLGAKGLPKGPFWDGRVAPGVTRSLISERDPVEHLRRRKPWNRAFSTTSLQAYEDILKERTSQFVGHLEKQTYPLDMDQWISFYTFDFMGDMAFGGGFELMRHGYDHTGVIELMDSAFERNNITAHVPYTLRYIAMMPKGASYNRNFLQFASERVAIRKREGAVRKDLFHHLIDEEGLEPHPPPMKELMSDGLLAVVAGSDTTSHVLVNVFYLLMKNPGPYAKLQAEVDKMFPAGASPLDTTKHREMPYLEAVINEAMRLQPPVPNGAQRSTQKTGPRVVAGHYLAQGTQVAINTYALHRDPRYFFPYPEEFWPERWLEPSDRANSAKPYKDDASAGFVHDTDAFFPFSFGPAMCVGRPLAYIQMRMVVSAVMQRFEMKLPPGKEYENIDAYAKAGRGVLPTILTVREGSVAQ